MNDLQTSETTHGIDFASAGPGTPAGILLRRFWQPIHVSVELAPGKAKPILIMGERYTLYRGESGTAYVVGFRCAHRGTQMSTGWVKGDDIRCLYHGWTYNGGGACVARPAENPPGPAANVSIPSIPTREHLGLIFAYFGEGEPPAFPPYPAFDDGGLVEASCDYFSCNWFQSYENSADEVHVAYVHSSGGSHHNLRNEKALPETWPEDAPFGMVRHSRVNNGPERTTLYIFPNVMRIVVPPFNGLKGAGGWRDTYITKVPTDDEHHLLFILHSAVVPPAEMPAYLAARAEFEERCAAARPTEEVTQDILDGKLHLSDVLDHPRLLVIEDSVAQAGQGVIADRDHEVLAQSDVCIVRMRRLIGAELLAIAQGRTGRTWVYEGQKPQRGF